MAETGAIRAGGAFVEISTRNSGFLKGLSAASAKLKAWGTAIGDIGKRLVVAGGAATGLLLSTLKVFADHGDELAKMSQRTGISVESLSELGYAANQSGTDIDTMEKSIRKMQQGLVGATDDGGAAAEAFTRLGLRVEDLRKLNPEDQFLAVGEALNKVKDPTLKAAIATDLFGKSGTALLPMLADGSEGLAMLRKRAADLGLVMSGDAAQAAVEFGDNMGDVWKQIKKVAFEIGASLAPELKELVLWLQQSLRGVIDWVKKNREAVVMALKVSIAVVGVGVALVGLGYGLTVAGTAMGALASAAIVVASAFAVAKAAVLLLLTPVGLVTAALVTLGVVAATQSGAIGEAVKWMGDRFRELWDDAKVAFGGIADALSAGEIGKAAAVAWAFIKLEWAKGINALEQYWLAFKQSFLQSWTDTVNTFVKLWISGVGAVKIAWINAQEFIGALGAKEAQTAREGAVGDVRGQFGMLNDESLAAERNAAAARDALVNSADLEKARQELKDAVSAAADARKASESRVTKSVKVATGIDKDDGTGNLMRITAKGIFNPRAIQSLQGTKEDKAGEKALKLMKEHIYISQESVDEIKRVREEIKKNGATFQ